MQPQLCLILAVLAVQLAVLHGSSVLQQAPWSMKVLTNEMANMTCDINTSIQSTSIYWLRQLHAASKDSQYEFLACWNPSKRTIYGSRITAKNLTVFCHSARCTLNLTSVKPSDSGTYFCATVGSPELNFGQGTRLSVVDFFPTTIQTTMKTTHRRKLCRLPNPMTKKGPACGFITLSLLVAGIMVLLVSLSVAIRLHCLQRKARRRFMKQFCK